MKFLYIGDLHQDDVSPINRIDDFEQTRKDKIKEIIEIAKKNKVKAILQGGDFFNRPRLSNEFLTELIGYWNNELIDIDIQDLTFKLQSGIITQQEYMKQVSKYTKNSIPIISIIGNHDIIADHLDSYPKTSLNVLETSGFLHIATKENPIVFQSDKCTVAISGSSYNRKYDKTNDKSGYIIENKYEYDNKEVDYQIHLTHGMLMSKSYGKKFAHTTIHEIAPYTKADLTINGHDHIGHEPVEIDNKYFANPGSPFRLSADKKEIDRNPKVLLIDCTDNGLVLKDIYLKTAKKGTDVLTRDDKVLALNKQNAMAKIQSLINQSALQRGLKIADIINDIGNAKNIDKDLLQDIQNKIIQFMNVLQPVYNPVGAYYITRLELTNFLSHKDSVFDFEPGLNILSGESRSGKSAVLRALREVFTCGMTQPRDAIFFGASLFKITVYTNTGYIVSRIVEREDKGFNGYEIFDPNTGNVTRYNTKAVTIVQEILGYNKIMLTEKKGIDINSIIQGDGWFYLGNSMTGPDRARLLGVVYGTHYADAYIKELSSSIKRVNSILTIRKKDITSKEKETEEYKYLVPLEKTISDNELLIEKLEKQEHELFKSKELSSDLTAIQNEIISLNNDLMKLKTDTIYLLNDLKLKQKDLQSIYTLYESLNMVSSSGKETRTILNSLAVINDTRNIFMNINIKKEELIELKDKYNKYTDLKQLSDKLEKEKNQLLIEKEYLNNIEALNMNYNNLKEERMQLDKFKEIVTNALELNQNMKNIQEQANETKMIQSSLNNLPTYQQLVFLINKREEIKKSNELIQQLSIIQTEGAKVREEASFNTNKVKEYINLYEQKLYQLGECPICHSKIDSIVVSALVKEHSEKFN